jgi:hypothetical protein
MKLVLQPAQRIVIEFEGKEYPCRKPQLGEVEDFEAAMEEAKAKGKGVTAVVTKHIVSCGLPAEVVRKLDTDQLEAVSDILAQAKKK